MKYTQRKTRPFRMRTFTVATLLSIAWIGSNSAQAVPWVGGDQTDNDPYYICFNVSADGKRLTALNTLCRGNQGQNQNSIDIQWQDGTFADGSRCNQYSYRDLSFGDIAITDNKFSTTFKNFFVDTTIEGTFDPATKTATGTARTSTRFSPECKITWEAAPATTPPQ